MNTQANISAKDRFYQGRRIFRSIIIFFISVILASLFTLSSFSDVERIQVEGNSEMSDDFILDQLAMVPGDSIFDIYWNRDRIEMDLTNRLAQVEESHLDYHFVNDYTIKIKEVPSVAYQDDRGKLLKVLANGERVEVENARQEFDLPKLTKSDDEEIDQKIVDQLSQIDPGVLALIGEVQHNPSDTNPDRLEVSMKDGNMVYATLSSFSDRINYYPAMKEAAGQTGGEFNLEMGAYFTPYSNDATDQNITLESEVNQAPTLDQTRETEGESPSHQSSGSVDLESVLEDPS